MNGAHQNGVETSGGWLTSRRFILLLGAALVVAFPLVTIGVRTFFYRDFGALGYPCTIFFRDSILHGELPLWNPYSHCGVPYLAQMGGWYLPTWPCAFLPLPWVVGGVMAAWQNGGRWLALAAGASAMQVLTATPELTLLTWLFLGALWLAEIFSGETKLWISASRVVAVVALAAGVTMVQMLPFFDLIAHSQRSANNAEAAAWAMPGWGWANLLVPLFHCYEGPQGNWFQTGQEFLQSYYLGAGVLALGVVGVVAARSRRAAVVAGMILFCWVMALGADGFFYERARKIFPLINVARFPVKFAILPAFLLPLLAAWGMEKIAARENKSFRRNFLLLAGVFIFLMAALVWFLRAYPFPNDTWSGTATNAVWRGVVLLALAAGVLILGRMESRRVRFATQIILLALLPVDAFTHSPRLVPTLPAGVLEPGMWEADGRAPVRLGAGRVMLSPAAEARMSYGASADFQSDFLGKRVAEWYNLNLLDSLPKVAGAFTLRPAGFDVIEQKLYYTQGARYGAPLLDFLSVQWFTSPTNAVEWLARTNFLPVITAGQAPRFVAASAIWPALAADDFDPRAVVYLPESARAAVTVSNRTECVVRSAQFSNNRITADVFAKAPSLVVLSQANYHRWRATVDGRPAEILPANLAFQALQVPAGEHRVELVYRDPNLVIGAVISLLSLAVCGVIWFKGGTPCRRP